MENENPPKNGHLQRLVFVFSPPRPLWINLKSGTKMHFSFGNLLPVLDSKGFTRGAGGKTRRPDVTNDHFLGGFHFPFDISALEFRSFYWSWFFSKFVFENLASLDKNDIQGDTHSHTYTNPWASPIMSPTEHIQNQNCLASHILGDIDIDFHSNIHRMSFFSSFFLFAPLRSCAHHVLDPKVNFYISVKKKGLEEEQ